MSGPPVDACCFAYAMDDHTLYTTERGRRALRHGANVVDTSLMNPCYWRRLGKSAERDIFLPM